jgi:hypothetical protein
MKNEIDKNKIDKIINYILENAYIDHTNPVINIKHPMCKSTCKEFLDEVKNMKNENFIKVQKVSNTQQTFYKIIYHENLNCGGVDDVILSYDESDIIELHNKIMHLETKLGVKATYKGCDINDFIGIMKLNESDMSNNIKNNIDDITKMSFINKEIYEKDIEELKNQLYVSEELNKELHKENYKMYENYIKLSIENIKTKEENKKLNEYLTQHKNNIYNLQDKIFNIEDEKYKLELKLVDYSSDSIILDEIRKEYNKTKCIPRFVFNGSNYIAENDFIKINMALQFEKQKNENINRQLNNVENIKVKILLDDSELKNIMDKNFNNNMKRLRKRLYYIGSKID